MEWLSSLIPDRSSLATVGLVVLAQVGGVGQGSWEAVVVAGVHL